MLRQCITYLRTRGFSAILPLDHHIYLHKITGLLVFLYSLVHTVMHLCNFSKYFSNSFLLRGHSLSSLKCHWLNEEDLSSPEYPVYDKTIIGSPRATREYIYKIIFIIMYFILQRKLWSKSHNTTLISECAAVHATLVIWSYLWENGGD